MRRKKLKRFAEIKEFENVFAAPMGRKPESLEQGRGISGESQNGLFAEIVELGCGSGDYTINLAQKFPKKNFIGIDRKGDRIWRGAKKALQLDLKNAAFIQANIDDLERFFQENSVEEIWITFPDPYPKPSRAKRRLTSPKFLEIYKKILKKNGVIHLKTDNLKLFDYSLKMFKACGFELDEEIRDLYSRKNLADILKIKTYYEEKFLKEGRGIYYCSTRRV